jgi:hypothetical protein
MLRRCIKETRIEKFHLLYDGCVEIKMSTKDRKSLVLIIISIFVFFSPILLQGRLPGPFEYLNIWTPWHNPEVKNSGNYILSDQVDHFTPNLSYLKMQLSSGVIPFWNPDVDFGTPFFNLVFGGHFYPPVAASLLFPIEYQWFISVVLRLLLTGFFMYKLLLAFRMEHSIALFGGIVSMFCLYSMVWVGVLNSYPYSAAPLFFYAITVFAEKSNRKSRTILAIGFINLILSGFLSVIFYVLFVGGWYSVFLFRSKFLKSQGAQLFAIGLLSVMVCIIPLFYAAQFLQNVNLEYRGTRGLIALPIKQIIQMGFPNSFGTYAGFGEQGLRNFNESTNYFSIVLVFFGAVNYLYLLIRSDYRANSMVLFWSVVQIWSIMMVYGMFDILALFSRLPVFENNPSTRLNIMIVFSSIIVGAFALQKTIFEPSPNKYIEKVILIGGSVAAIFVSLGLVVFYLEKYKIELSVIHMGRQLFILIVSALLALSASIVASMREKTAFVAFISLITFVNLSLIGGNYNSSYLPETFYPKTEIIRHLTSNLESGGKVITVGRNLIPHMGLFYGIGSIQSHWWSTSSQEELLRAFDPDYKTRAHTQDFFDSIDLEQDGELLDFLNIQYIVVNDSDLENMIIDENEYHLLRFPYGVNLLENLHRPFTLNPPLEICNDEMIYNFHYESNSIRFSTNLCHAKTLTLPVWNFSGWQLMQASNASIMMSDSDDLIAISLPAGQQEVLLEYRPTHFSVLLGVSLASLILLIALLLSEKMNVPKQYDG